MFVDASAIVAILDREPEAAAFLDTLQTAAAPITSAVAIYEAVLGLARRRRGTAAVSRQDVHDLLTATGIRIVPITAEQADAALVAHARFGKGTGHPAQLNMGDCFAYATAQAHGVGLLFKGNDFIHTDIRRTDIALP